MKRWHLEKLASAVQHRTSFDVETRLPTAPSKMVEYRGFIMRFLGLVPSPIRAFSNGEDGWVFALDHRPRFRGGGYLLSHRWLDPNAEKLLSGYLDSAPLNLHELPESSRAYSIPFVRSRDLFVYSLLL